MVTARSAEALVGSGVTIGVAIWTGSAVGCLGAAAIACVAVGLDEALSALAAPPNAPLQAPPTQSSMATASEMAMILPLAVRAAKRLRSITSSDSNLARVALHWGAG